MTTADAAQTTFHTHHTRPQQLIFRGRGSVHLVRCRRNSAVGNRPNALAQRNGLARIQIEPHRNAVEYGTRLALRQSRQDSTMPVEELPTAVMLDSNTSRSPATISPR